jgi:NADH-quinone oxidoreductase subunit N
VEVSLTDQLQWISDSTQILAPEIVLTSGVLFLISLNLFKVKSFKIYGVISLITVVLSGLIIFFNWPVEPTPLFNYMLRADDFSAAYKLLFLMGTALAIIMSFQSKNIPHPTEYFSLLLATTLGAHLLVMSTNFVMVILSLELISISSYVLAGFRFSKQGAEGSLKYFLFGSAATAVMIYGASLLFGLTGTLHFASSDFANKLIEIHSPLLLIAGFFILAGFLFKSSAAPFHLWAPDVYEAAPLPIVAFFSVVPNLAGIAALMKFTLAINLFGQSSYDWQTVLAVVAILSIVIGNLSALWQKNAIRMMAYSSIAQAGFLIAAIVPLTSTSMHFLVFYSAVFLIMNFSVFILLQHFGDDHDATLLSGFSGLGKRQVFSSVLLLIAFISLTGLPPTGGFTAKLFIFSSIWEAYEQTGKNAILWLLIAGLLNTVIALFFYLKIPYYLFIKDNRLQNTTKSKFSIFPNLLAFILVVVLLLLFFYPALLMGWTNRINFVL